MSKHVFLALVFSLFGYAASAQTAPNTQTTQRTPTGNRTAGTTSNPVDPTSDVSNTITGNNPAAATNGTAPASPMPAQTAERTPTGNRTAGTTNNPVDPTSKVSTRKADAGAQLKGRKAGKGRKDGM